MAVTSRCPPVPHLAEAATVRAAAFAFATIPWKYPPGDDRKCAIATAMAGLLARSQFWENIRA